MSNLLISIFAFIGIHGYEELKKSDYGRNYGWWVELDGKVLGELINVKWEEMFWDSYELWPIDKGDEAKLFDTELWDNNRFKFRNKKFNRYAEFAFPGGIGDSVDVGSGNRILMRGLYILKP